MTAAAEGLVVSTESIALRFLHSVVLIDDRVYLAPSGADEESVPPAPVEIVSPGRHGAVPAEEGSAAVAAAAGGFRAAEHPLDAKPLLDRFAAKGLVCAVLRLDTVEEVAVMARAARRADIVVLDWKMIGTYGDRTMELIREILGGEGERDRLRLIAIYTGENDLLSITKRIQGELGAMLGGEVQQDNEVFSVRRGPVRIVVYAKAGTMLPKEDPELHRRIMTAEELPDRLVSDFAQMTSGLVSGVALEALACLRANMHRILRRLHPGLDAAYLSHRALVTPPEKAEDHLVSVVVSEVESILDENFVGCRADLAAIRLWLADRIRGGTDFKRAFGLGTAEPLAALSALLEGGVGNASVPAQLEQLKGKKKSRGLTALFSAPDSDSKQRDCEFAGLLSLCERYALRPPFLTLGTLLATSSGGAVSYWLCVQPVCDAVRLTGGRRFPLMPLRVVGENDGFYIVLPGESDAIRLTASMRPFEQELPIFCPDEHTRTVKPQVKEGGGMFFTARDGVEYRWVGELKAQHAQRLVHVLGSQQARVGVVESEWMRRSRGE